VQAGARPNRGVRTVTDSGTVLRESGVECEHCGCTSRRPDSNRCAACGRYAPDPRYARSPLTGKWYRVSDWDELEDGKIVAKSKEEVDREDVPEHWAEAIEEATEA
jgi:ribosomal protein L37E